MRSKHEHGLAVHDRARGAGGMAVDGSMGVQRARSSGGMTGDGGDVGTTTMAWRP